MAFPSLQRWSLSWKVWSWELMERQEPGLYAAGRGVGTELMVTEAAAQEVVSLSSKMQGVHERKTHSLQNQA